MSEVSHFAVQEKLKSLSVLLRFNDVIGNTNVLQALYHTGKKEWMQSVNANTQEHLIKDIYSAGFKTDAVNHYVSVLAKVFLSSQGANLSAWTKNSMEQEHVLTAAVVSRMGTKQYTDHDGLFIDVATRLLGFDKTLVDYVISLDDPEAKRTDLLVGYVSSQYDDLIGIDNAEIYFDDLIQHLKHVDLVKDRNELIETAIKILNSTPDITPYNALLESVQTVIGYVVGPADAAKDKVFTFGAAQY